MDTRSYEISIFAAAIWRCAQSEDINELTAVGCALRNRVRRLGSYTAVVNTLEDFSAHTLRRYPQVNEASFSDPTDGLLNLAERIYTNETADITSTHDHVDGAMIFSRPEVADTDEDGVVIPGTFSKLIKDLNYVLLGTWGTMQFFGPGNEIVAPQLSTPARQVNNVSTFELRSGGTQ